ncbi:MAG: iron-sulfur cluster assembly accessory protein [Planctomycetota bacterium]|nr:MAG: iron-sulfur cluster assembly accessory protein [Planctomycetota bacterium]
MITVTPRAQEEARKVLEKEKLEGAFLRIGVTGGGCAGFQYDMRVDNKIQKGDRVFEFGGVKFVCDLASFPYLSGTTLDYSDSLVAGGFQFKNPNATGTCGCGTSFSI